MGKSSRQMPLLLRLAQQERDDPTFILKQDEKEASSRLEAELKLFLDGVTKDRDILCCSMDRWHKCRRAVVDKEYILAQQKLKKECEELDRILLNEQINREYGEARKVL